jgi:23S rRNA (guanosine2251-2'-O)-methyltransferase
MAIILEGAISVLSAIDSKYSKVLKIIIKQGVSNRNTQKILTLAKAKNIMTEYLSHEEMQKYYIGIGRTHGGIIAVAEKRGFLSPRELLAGKPGTVAVIEGIEDPYNLGYAARALYTQGTDALILPERDFGLSEAIIEKASTGTFSKMPIAVFDSKTDLINLLKSEAFKIYCIDKKASSASVFNVKFADKTVFIIGGEKRGVSKDFLNNADEIVSIPYAKKFPHSLAAQTAATIISYEIHRQKKAPF